MHHQWKRREFITLLGGAAATWPLAARAQQSMPVVGFLNSASPDAFALVARPFHRGLNEAGFVEGRNVAFEYRWADGRNDRLPAFAADLVQRRVGLIATDGVPSTLAARAATATVPIVFRTGVDPVAFGLVASLSRPGGNLTGVTTMGQELEPKRLELLNSLASAPAILAALINPTNPVSEGQARGLQAAASTIGRQVHIQSASTEHELTNGFASLAAIGTRGLVIASDPFFNSHSDLLAKLSIRHAIIAIYQYHEFAAAGGLMSYGGGFAESWRLAGAYAGRILKGENPADLPVQQATKVELIINLKTAKALRIDVPPTLLARADEVIE
jgi:putative tryptophan/tyrosine transport system substrate-binding protein